MAKENVKDFQLENVNSDYLFDIYVDAQNRLHIISKTQKPTLPKYVPVSKLPDIEMFMPSLEKELAEKDITPEERAQMEAEAKAKEEAERLAKEEAERKAREEEEARIKAEEEAKLQAQREAEEKARAEEEARSAAEQAQKEEEERLAREQAEAEERARLEAEEQARKEAEEQAKAEEEARLAAEQAEAEAKAEEERKAQEEQERLEAEAKAQEEADAQAKAEAEAKAEEEARLQAEKEAEEAAEAERLAKEAEEAAEAERLAKEAEEKAKVEEAAKVEEEAPAPTPSSSEKISVISFETLKGKKKPIVKMAAMQQGGVAAAKAEALKQKSEIDAQRKEEAQERAAKRKIEKEQEALSRLPNAILIGNTKKPSPELGKFEIVASKDPEKPFKFVLKTEADKVVFETSPMKTKPNELTAVMFKDIMQKGSFTFTRSLSGGIIFKILDARQRVFYTSRSYLSIQDAQRAAALIKKYGLSANYIDDTTI